MKGSLRNLLNLASAELEAWVAGAGFEKYRGRQIFQWLYKKSATDFDSMSDLPQDLRDALKAAFYFHLPKVVEAKPSADGTLKFLFELEDGERIEAVVISDEDRRENTLCLSTQVGCRYGCGFCYTGTMSFKRNLSSGEMLGQYFAARARLAKRAELHRLVFMGMGEPLDNFEELKKTLGIITSRQGLDFSSKRITVSTAGVIPYLDETWGLGVHLAVSINAADPAQRTRLMPINKKYPVEEVVKALKKLDRSGRQKLTAEYVLLKGFNDSIEDAHRLARLLSGLDLMVNLIRFNAFPGCAFEPSEEKRALSFQDRLKSAGFMVFIRKSKGQDILAACGQLRGSRP